MISKVTLRRFKRFNDETTFDVRPEGLTFVAGGNNCGKSTLLQALAVWEYARTVVEVSRGSNALLAGPSRQGMGVSASEFSALALPDLKHLWSGLRPGASGGGYNLKVRCDWALPGAAPGGRHLEFGFALANDRLFIRTQASNLAAGDTMPHMAYLPSFAGIEPREERLPHAARARWIGKGLAGAVLRNLLYDLWDANLHARDAIRGPRGRYARKALADLKKKDAWERLVGVLEEVFRCGLSVREYNELFHSAIQLGVWEGQLRGKQFRKKPGSTDKDLMAEGSGFLQWLSVYALALNDKVDVLLLDEPDAHLHPALQGHLIHKLSQIARENRKQVLLATHSTTILTETNLDRIFRMEERRYLTSERDRVALFVGLGSAYAPRLDQLKRVKRLFLHDGPSDLEILQAWATVLGVAWPEGLVCWECKGDRKERETLHNVLRGAVPDLRTLSLQDRDDYPLAATQPDLTFDSLPPFRDGLALRRWRRRNIENYLLLPAAIARAVGCTEPEVCKVLADVHSLTIGPDFRASGCAPTLALIDGKFVFIKHERSLEKALGANRRMVAAAMTPDEIPDDVRTLLNDLAALCAP